MVGSLLRALSCFDDGKEALAVGYFFTFVSIVLAFCGLSFWGFPAFFFYKIVNTAQNFIECWSIQASHASASQLCLIFGYEVIYVKLRT